jgi:hypothetical protein
MQQAKKAKVEETEKENNSSVSIQPSDEPVKDGSPTKQQSTQNLVEAASSVFEKGAVASLVEQEKDDESPDPIIVTPDEYDPKHGHYKPVKHASWKRGDKYAVRFCSSRVLKRRPLRIFVYFFMQRVVFAEYRTWPLREPWLQWKRPKAD